MAAEIDTLRRSSSAVAEGLVARGGEPTARRQTGSNLRTRSTVASAKRQPNRAQQNAGKRATDK
jgi:hypothetical protein